MKLIMKSEHSLLKNEINIIYFITQIILLALQLPMGGCPFASHLLVLLRSSIKLDQCVVQLWALLANTFDL